MIITKNGPVTDPSLLETLASVGSLSKTDQESTSSFTMGNV